MRRNWILKCKFTDIEGKWWIDLSSESWKCTSKTFSSKISLKVCVLYTLHKWVDIRFSSGGTNVERVLLTENDVISTPWNFWKNCLISESDVNQEASVVAAILVEVLKAYKIHNHSVKQVWLRYFSKIYYDNWTEKVIMY